VCANRTQRRPHLAILLHDYDRLMRFLYNSFGRSPAHNAMELQVLDLCHESCR